MYEVTKLIRPKASVKSWMAHMALTNAFADAAAVLWRLYIYCGRIIEDRGRLLITHRMVRVWEMLGRRGLYHSEMREQELGSTCAFCGETYLKRKPKLFLPSWSMRVRRYFLPLRKVMRGTRFWYLWVQVKLSLLLYFGNTFTGQNVCPVHYKSGASCLSDKASVFKVPHCVLNAFEEGVLYFKYL